MVQTLKPMSEESVWATSGSSRGFYDALGDGLPDLFFGAEGSGSSEPFGRRAYEAQRPELPGRVWGVLRGLSCADQRRRRRRHP